MGLAWTNLGGTSLYIEASARALRVGACHRISARVSLKMLKVKALSSGFFASFFSSRFPSSRKSFSASWLSYVHVIAKVASVPGAPDGSGGRSSHGARSRTNFSDEDDDESDSEGRRKNTAATGGLQVRYKRRGFKKRAQKKEIYVFCCHRIILPRKQRKEKPHGT
jgi:hypothetical protein